MNSFVSRIHTLFDHVPYEQNTVLSSAGMSVIPTTSTTNLDLENTLEVLSLTGHEILAKQSAQQVELERVEYNEMVEKAKESIVERSEEKIRDNDTILIFGYSEIIEEVLLLAVRNKKRFSLIILEDNNRFDNDSNNNRENQQPHALKILGPELKQNLLSIIHVHLNSLSFVIRKVTKLFLHPYGLLSNGNILGRLGTAQIALMASNKNIPVIICCETYKFFDKLPTDSFFQNEKTTGTTPALTASSKTDREVQDQQESNVGKYLRTSVLKYDITPTHLVTAVITEVDIFPSTSIPLLLRVQEKRNNNKSKIHN